MVNSILAPWSPMEVDKHRKPILFGPYEGQVDLLTGLSPIAGGELIIGILHDVPVANGDSNRVDSEDRHLVKVVLREPRLELLSHFFFRDGTVKFNELA